MGQAVQDYGITDKCDYAYKSVHFKGTAFLIDDLLEKQHGMKVMVRQLSENPKKKLARINHDKLAKTKMIGIDIKYMTGKKHK